MTRTLTDAQRARMREEMLPEARAFTEAHEVLMAASAAGEPTAAQWAEWDRARKVYYPHLLSMGIGEDTAIWRAAEKMDDAMRHLQALHAVPVEDRA